MDDALPLFLQTAWSYVVRDIDRTVQTGMVSESVFKGCSMYTCFFFGLESHMAWGEIQQKIPHPKKWLIEIFANPVPSVVIHQLGRFKATVHRRM